MALSGNFRAESDINNIGIKFNWTASQSISSNTSTVSWTLVVDRPTNKESHTYFGPVKVVVNGNTYQRTADKGQIYLNNGQTILSGTTSIPHNADGTKTFPVSIASVVYYGTSHNYNASGSTNFTLNPIARKATITSVPNFTDEGGLTFSYSNPAGSAATKLETCITLASNTNSYLANYRDISKTGNKYTYKFSQNELNAIYAASKNSNSIEVHIYISTNIGSNRYHDYKKRTLTIVNAQPEINPSIWDSWATSVSATGTQWNLVRDKSNASYDAQPILKKGATLKSCKVTNGTKTVSSANATGMIENPLESVFHFTLTDSRGNVVNKDVPKTLIPYVRPSINVKANIVPTSGGKATLKISISGEAFNKKFGEHSQAKANTITTTCAYSTNGGTNYTTVSNPFTLSYSQNNYTSVCNIPNVNENDNFKVKVSIADILSSPIYDTVDISLTPIFDWSATDFNFNVPIHVNNKPIYYVIEEGTVDGWRYKIWNNKFKECWRQVRVEKPAITDPWSSQFMSPLYGPWNYPTKINFVEVPKTVISVSGIGGFVYGMVSNNDQKKYTGTVKLLRPSSATLGAAVINIYAAGY